jgi:hypothetical protein
MNQTLLKDRDLDSLANTEISKGPCVETRSAPTAYSPWRLVTLLKANATPTVQHCLERHYQGLRSKETEEEKGSPTE